MIPRLARAAGVAIAILGAIDPAVTSMRSARPDVAVVATGAASNAALADRVAGELRGRFTVVRGPFAGASAVVAVGDRLPAAAGTFGAPAFAVTPDAAVPGVTIEAVSAPARAPYDATVTVAATARVTHARGRTLDVTLERAGLVVGRVARLVASDDERARVSLAFVPTAAGSAALRVVAQVGGAAASAAADLAVDVRDERWAVLVFDGRPSWMSTFVRRAIEADPRFVVRSRVVTSRNVSADTGRPPAALDLSSLALFDVVVIGAPDALSDRDVAGLDAFMRRRGGAVVMLIDRREPGPYDRLLGVDRWAETKSAVPFALESRADGAKLQASELAWPVVLPPGADAIVDGAAKDAQTERRPVAWRAPVGAGRIVVSGMLDAWRFRDASPPVFDRFWRGAVADAASAAPPPISVQVETPVLAPGASTTVHVTLRDAALADVVDARPIIAGVSAAIETTAGVRTPLRLWPDGRVGEFSGTIRAPEQPGAYRVVASSEGARADAPLTVLAGAVAPAPDERDLLDAWVQSRGGTSFPASQSRDVVDAIARAVQPASRRQTWHPMRSAWWIAPFVALVGAEWWWRRQRGLR